MKTRFNNLICIASLLFLAGGAFEIDVQAATNTTAAVSTNTPSPLVKDIEQL